MKKVLKIVLWSLLALVLLAGIGTWSKFGSLVKGAMSVKQLDEGLYYMEYRGDDGFDELIARGGGRNSAELAEYAMFFLSKGYYHPPITPAPAQYGCSALTTRTPENGILMGRNFDFSSATGLILHTIPKRGYETITTFNVEFFGFDKDWKPEGFVNQYMALSSLFFALDGINESCGASTCTRTSAPPIIMPSPTPPGRASWWNMSTMKSWSWTPPPSPTTTCASRN